MYSIHCVSALLYEIVYMSATHSRDIFIELQGGAEEGQVMRPIITTAGCAL